MVIGVALGLVLLIGGGAWYYASQALVREFDAAMSQNNLVTGAINAYGAYQKAVNEKGADSDMVKEMARKASPVLAQKRQALLDAWYRESDIGDATWEDHLKICEWLSKISPGAENTGQYEYAQGMYLLNSKNNARDAISHFLSALNQKPNWILAVNGVGRSYRKLEDKAQALFWYEKAYSVDARWPFCVINLADIVEDHLKDHTRAESLYREALRLASDRPTFHWRFATFLFNQGKARYPEACEEYRQSLNLPGTGSRALSPQAEKVARERVQKICGS